MNTSTPNPAAKPNLKTPNASPGTSPLTPIFCSPYSENQCSSVYQSALDWSLLNDSASNYNRTGPSSTDNDDLTLGREHLNLSFPNAQDMQQPNFNNKDHTILQAQVEAKSPRKNDTILNTGSKNSSIIEISPFVHYVQEDDVNNDDDGVNEALIGIANATKQQQQQQQKDKEKEAARSNFHIIDSFKSKYESDNSNESANRTLSSSDADDCCNNDKVQLNGGGGVCNTNRSLKKREIKIYNTIDEFERNLPPTVTMLETPFGSKVYLVGTSHFSEESQVDVSLVIQNVRPDVVMVELCPSRIHILKLDEKTLLEEAKSFNFAKIRSIIKTNGYINGIFFMLLLQMSAQMARDLGMAPGGEFRRAFQEVHKLPGCMLHLGDRPIRITLKRALHTLSIWQTIKLMWRLTSSHTISIEEVEECKQRDLLEKVMEEVAGEFPAFSDVFVNERDIYLCHSLQLAALPQAAFDGSSEAMPVRVVGVVGIGHARGITENWGRVDPEVIPKIMEIPPSKLSMRICKYTIKYGTIGLTMYIAFKIVRPRFLRFF